MKYIALLILLLPSLALACLPTDGKHISVTGMAISAVYKTEEQVVHYRALELDDVQCFSPDGEFSEAEVKIKKIQLIIPEGIEFEVGRKYKVEGAAFHWHTAHHYTEIVLTVSAGKNL